MKAFIRSCAILLIALPTVAAGQLPDWADSKMRKIRYPDSDFIVGFASEPNSQRENPADLLKRLEGYAKGQLIEYIQVTVKSETTIESTETSKGFKENYHSMYSSSSNLNLSGLRVETSYDQKGRTGYALAIANRGEMLGLYKGQINSNLQNAEVKVKSAQEAMNANNGELAFKLSAEAISLIPPVEQAQTVVIALRRGMANEEDLQTQRVLKVKSDLEALMRNVQRSSSNTIDDICYFIAKGLHAQTGNINTPVALSNFTYQDTRIASQLSGRLNQSLISKLVSTAGYSVIPSGARADGYLLTGTYWKEPNDLKIIATLKKIDGTLVAASEAFLPLAWVQASDVKYLPENFEEAFSRMKAFNKDEVIKGDLNLEIWTNKGDENLVYTEGERLKFYVRANKECYIRMIYHLADNQSVLLMDNYYIAAHMANKVVELPDEFECSEPFGVETLQVNAQTEAFEPLRTRNMYGYQFIVESLNDILLGTRGLKKVSEVPVDRAEKRIVFTTMPR
jgi:hypothetical protein